MKAHERREAGITTSYRVATWNPRNMTWKEVRGTFPTEHEARQSARKPGRYRVSRVEDGTFSDAGTFEV